MFTLIKRQSTNLIMKIMVNIDYIRNILVDHYNIYTKFIRMIFVKFQLYPNRIFVGWLFSA